MKKQVFFVFLVAVLFFAQAAWGSDLSLATQDDTDSSGDWVAGKSLRGDAHIADAEAKAALENLEVAKAAYDLAASELLNAAPTDYETAKKNYNEAKENLATAQEKFKRACVAAAKAIAAYRAKTGKDKFNYPFDGRGGKGGSGAKSVLVPQWFQDGATTLGYKDVATVATVKKFQTDHGGLKVDGVAGKATRKALAEALAAKGGDEAGEDEAAVAPAVDVGGELKKISSDLELIRSNQLAISRKHVSPVSIMLGLGGYGAGGGESSLAHIGGEIFFALVMRPSSRNILKFSGSAGSSGAGLDLGAGGGYLYEFGEIRFIRFGAAGGYQGIGLDGQAKATIGTAYFGPELQVRLIKYDDQPHWMEPWMILSPYLEYGMRDDGTSGLQPGVFLGIAVEFDTSK